jgi:hypothetical protein
MQICRFFFSLKHEPPLICNLNQDPSERFEDSARQQKILSEIAKTVAKHKAAIKPVKTS